jgi:hypothetical protein
MGSLPIISPMMATPSTKPFDDLDWLFETTGLSLAGLAQ